jgi:hypothetical protein
LKKQIARLGGPQYQESSDPDVLFVFANQALIAIDVWRTFSSQRLWAMGVLAVTASCA